MKAGKKPLKIIILFAVVAVFVVLTLLVTGKKKTSEKQSPLPAVTVQKPVRKDLTESVIITGYVEANAMIPVVPFVSGTIMEYPVQAGAFVKKDTLLAKIDDAPFRQQLIQAEAAYFAARSTFERVENLYKSGATTQQNYDSAKAQHDASKAQYDLAKLQVNYTEVRAPVDGTVLIADQAVGSIGTQTAPVAVLADLSNQVVRLKVPEKYFDLFTMEKGALKVTVIRPSQEGMYEDAVTSATIQNIAPYVNPESKNFIVVCALDNPGDRFRPGMYVKVQVAYRTHENAAVLPMQAKKMDGSCYIYKADDKTVHYLAIGDTPTDNEYFIIPEEYAGEYFVTDGYNYVFDGQQVRLFDDAVKEYLAD